RHLVNLGAGPAERTLRDQQERIKANIPGTYQIAAVSVKGGVGKTRMIAAVGSVFGTLRNEPVIAIDANPTYGGLGRLIDPKAAASVREFLAAEDLVEYPKARAYTGRNKQGLEVLTGNQNVANPLALTPATFAATVARTRRFYQLALVDCGAEIEHQVIPAVLSASDALMVVGSCNVDGGLAVETTLDWLAARNGHELLKRSVIVLNDAYRCANSKFLTHVTHTLGSRVHAVKTIPWDAHLRDAATLDFAALRRRTQLALIDLAAELAGGFPTAGALT
ncbi:MinD/ParA family ATP-binding protein, partial [Mycobacterium simiae]|uniref:MinD/ParA family ATP-binding protein n=1 Tax=Mycobacterium simiae TaxID=1784 RepID=UPI001CB71E24